MSVKSFFSYDILEHLVKFYKNIPALYKTTFWTVFIALNIVFAYHTINFMWSNHEWMYIREGIAWNNFWYEARFTETLPYGLFGFELLPILLSLFAFAGISMSMLSLAIYWKIPKEKWVYVLFGLMMAFIPYNLSWLYHIAQTSFVWGCFIIVSALLLLEKTTSRQISRWWHLIIIFLLWFVLGFNASFINTIFICFIGRILIDLCYGEKFFTLLKKGIIGLIDISVAAALLKGAVALAIKYNVLANDFYNTTTITLSDIPSKLKEVAGYSLEQFTITYPFFEKPCLYAMWGISILALLTIVWKLFKRKLWFNIPVAITCLLGILFASQLAIFISDNRLHLQFLFRLTGFFSLYFIFALMLAILCNFWRITFLKNILFILTIIITGLFIQRDAYAMRVWKNGWDAENKAYDRIMARIENTPDFTYDKRYQIALIGDLSLRSHYYRGEYKNKDSSLLNWSYRAPWLQQDYMNFYAPTDFVKKHFHSGWTMEYTEELFRDLPEDTLNYIYENAAPWPASGSVILRDNLILVFIDKNKTSQFKRLLREYMRKRQSLSTEDVITHSIQVSHPAWLEVDTLRFLTADRILRIGINDTATVLEFNNNHLVVKWDDYGIETFINNGSGVYEYTDEKDYKLPNGNIIKASHKDWIPAWEPQAMQFISKDKIIHVANADVAFVEKHTDTELILDWYAHGTERFVKDKNGVYRFANSL